VGAPPLAEGLGGTRGDGSAAVGVLQRLPAPGGLGRGRVQETVRRGPARPDPLPPAPRRDVEPGLCPVVPQGKSPPVAGTGPEAGPRQGAACRPDAPAGTRSRHGPAGTAP